METDMPQPALINQEIAKFLTTLFNRDSKASQFELARLDSMIIKLSKADELSANCVRGAWYALQGDKINSQKMHKLTIQKEPTMADLYFNYANSLYYLLDFDGAIEQLLKAIDLSPNDIGYLDLMLALAYHCDNSDLLEKYLPIYESLTGTQHPTTGWLEEDKEDLKDLPSLISKAQKEGFVSWDKVKTDAGL